MENKIINWQGEKLRKKIYRLINLGFMYEENDIINLTGTTYHFNIPLLAN